MTASVYTTSVTGSVTATPYERPKPTIRRLLEYLCGPGRSVGDLIETSVRDLARAVGSPTAGQFSVYLRRLAADGWIEVAASAECTLVQVTRLAIASQGDHATDRCAGDAHGVPDENPPHDRQAEPIMRLIASQSDQGLDRPPLHGTHDSLESQQQQRARESTELATDAHPLHAPLRAAGADPQVAAEIIRACPDRTPDDLATDLQLAAQRPGVRRPVGLVLRVWRAGGRVRPSHSAPPDPVRPTPSRARPDGPPPRALADLQAEVAQRQAAQHAAAQAQDRAALRQVLAAYRREGTP